MPTSLSIPTIKAAIEVLREKKDAIDVPLQQFIALLKATEAEQADTGPDVSNEEQPVHKKKRTISVKHQKAIQAAQKKRWEKFYAARAGEEVEAAEPPEPPKQRRTMSAQGRANIIAALKKRHRKDKRLKAKAMAAGA